MSLAISLDLDTLDSLSQLLSADVVLEEERAGAAVDPLVGTTFAGRYRVLGVLGRGGMGIVYEVEHLGIGKILAMKLLAGPLADHPTVRRRFRLEALAASRLESAHTVQVLDFGVSEGRSYLVMERVAGESMASVLTREGPMSERRVARIVVQICHALAEAHAKGVVHRDIKPDNIMLTLGPDGEEHAKVLDFGLAKVREVQGTCDVTTRGTILGTPYYMAPEQILGEDVDGRVDVYALGALMYRALTGSHLFTGRAADVLAMQLTAEPRTVREHPRGARASPAMDRMVTAALVKDRGRRTGTVEELRAQLTRALENLELSTEEDGPEVAGWLASPLVDDASRCDGATRRLGTRDDLEAYERDLLRRRYDWIVFGVAMLLVLAAAVVVIYGPVRGAAG